MFPHKKCKFNWWTLSRLNHCWHELRVNHWQTAGMSNLGYDGIDMQELVCCHCGTTEVLPDGYHINVPKISDCKPERPKQRKVPNA